MLRPIQHDGTLGPAEALVWRGLVALPLWHNVDMTQQQQEWKGSSQPQHQPAVVTVTWQRFACKDRH